MDKESSSFSKKMGDCPCPENKIELKNKDAKHQNQRGKRKFENSTNQFFSPSARNPGIAPRISHKLSNCTQSDERKYPCHQCSAKFRFRSCLEQHLQIHSVDITFSQKDCLTKEILSTQVRYWKDKLIDYETLNLITDYPRPSELNYAVQNIYFELDASLSRSLRNLAEQLDVSLHTVLLCGYYLMLRIYSNQDDIVIGTLLAKEHYARSEEMTGNFSNMLALRIQINSTCLLKDFIRQVGCDIITGQLHQDLPFKKIVEKLPNAKDTNRHPIFQVMFDQQNFKTSLQSQNVEETGLANLLNYYIGKSRYNVAELDLTTVIDDSGSVPKGAFIYASTLYKEETIRRYVNTYIQILSQLSTLDTDQSIKDHKCLSNLNYLSTEQYTQIIQSWNKTDKEYPANKTIHQLFEEQVVKTPDNIAIVFKEVKLTYREINERANQLAFFLIDKFNIEPDSLVPLFLDRSEYMIIAILAVLKSGGAYVPIDPSYPDERIQYILQDTKASFLLTNEIHCERLRCISCLGDSNLNGLSTRQPVHILCIDGQEFKDKLFVQAVNNPKTLTTSNHLAYVIFTSGTTGKPKGVMLEHRGLVNLNHSLVNRYELGETSNREVILQLCNYVFDFSVEQFLIALLNGHVLLLIPNQLWLDKEQFINYLLVNKVTHISATPRFLEQCNFDDILSLKRIVSGGDYLSKQSYDKLNSNINTNIINVYGPTETSVVSVLKMIKNGVINIGSPIFNARCYVLAENLVPVPVGAIGELCIGGAGLARGYLNRPDLTAERFIANPFQTEEEKILGKCKRLYKTGDLVRWLKDGNLEYIGRNDFQVKIRGYRIELGEIESTLLGYKGIKQCVALATKNINVSGDPSSINYLVGYYVSDDKLDEEAMRHYLGSKLPDYMVPTILVHLNKLPLTVNGKLDRTALPDPQFSSKNKYVGPRNEIEEKLCQIWTDVLGLATGKVGIHDDFFRLGGDSIISIQLVSRIRKFLRLNVSVKDIFIHKTITSLYENVLSKAHNLENVSTLQSEQGSLVGAVPLIPIQEWFFSRYFSTAHDWNQSFLIKTPKLDLNRLQDSLDKLIQHHDCFRLRYKKDERSNTYAQYYDGHAKIEPIRVLDISTPGYPENSKEFKTNLQELLTNWRANSNLTDGPMYSVGYIFGYQDGTARIHFAIHHLIVDAVSGRVISEDLQDLYNGKTLRSKGSSFRQWANMVKGYPSKHPEEKHYWNNILSDYNSSRLNNLIESESTVNFASIELSQEYTNFLLQESNQAYHTQINELLLTALGYSLTYLTGCKINHILLESHGREEIVCDINITRTMGCFTTICPVRLETFDALRTSIISIKELLRTIPHKGLGFGPLLGFTSNALPGVSFNYLGQDNQEKCIHSRDNDMWQIVTDSGISASPNTYDTNVINFNGQIIDGRLTFSIESKLDEVTTNNLASVFEQQLKVVINHTLNQPRSYLTLSDINHIISKERLDALQKSREIEAIYLANNLQQGLIYHALSQGNVDDAYIVQHLWQYHSSLNINNLEQAWGHAQIKYSTLRLRFDWQEKLVQIIEKGKSLDWRYIDISDELNKEVQKNIIKSIQEKDRSEGFDLAQGTLFRIYLIKQAWNLFSCIFSNHHCILDGWSMPILLEYVHETYLRLGRKEIIISQTDCAYKAAQHYIFIHQEDYKAYWDKYIAQVEGRSDFRGLLLSSEKKLSEYKQILQPIVKTLVFSRKLYSSLKVLSQHEGVTLNAILQYVWHKVLHIFGNNEQTIVGTTLSGRSIPLDEIEKSVGLYINTVPLIVNHNASKYIIESIKDIQSTIMEFNEKSLVNLAKLQQSDERLFDSLFVYENYPNPASVAQAAVKLKYEGVVEKLDYPLVIIAYEEKDKLILRLQYAGELFSEVTINSLLCVTETILKQLPSGAHQVVSNLNYLNNQQYDQVIHRWNATNKEYPANKTIHQLFEEQVVKTPDNIAIVFKEVKFTYREINERANQLAFYLIDKFNIEPDSLVPLFLDRSEYMIIVILAVLKSGGAYVPIDPSYPDERIQYILQDTKASFLLTNEIHCERLRCISCLGDSNLEGLTTRQPVNILCIDGQEFKDKLFVQAVNNPKTLTTSNHLAYVIYTSGTTGKPKGVMLEHRGLVNLNHALVNIYELRGSSEREVISQISNYVFDLSVEQMILGLLNGHVLLLIPNQLWMNEDKFYDYLFKNKVTHINGTPKFLEQHNFKDILTLRRIVSAGDVFCNESYGRMRFNDSINIINTYGLTEASVTSLVKVLGKGNVNIGSPIFNTRCYVLTHDLVPVPLGAIGELYVGGVSLARGYLNRPDLTAERFIANPFQTQEEKRLGKFKRLYKTGDLVRWLPDGNLDYIGRNDFQVKIRGYRIELGEIERALLSCKEIKQSVVMVKEHNTVGSGSSVYKYLVGYYVSDIELDQEKILHYLGSKLPDYMKPTILIHLNKLPLTINGKLDRKALPDPELTSQDNYAAPRNEIEKKVRHIWAEVLGLDTKKISTNENFFRLGGDSIISIQMVSQIRKKLQLNVTVKDIFHHKSIAKLYENVLSRAHNLDNVSTLQTEQGILVGAVPLLPVQEWFFSRNFRKAHHWNQSFLIKTPRLDLDKLQDSLEKLIQHHDCFRLRYKKDERNNHYEQYYDSYAKVEPIRVLDIESLGYEETSHTFNTKLQEILTNWQANFDFTNGPMHSVGYIHGYHDGSARVYFALHHLIVDTVSWRILSEDLRDLYYGKTLDSKGSSYRQWAKILQDYPSKHHEEELFWHYILSDQDNNLLYNLIESESTVNIATVELNQEYTTLLLQESNLSYHTQINDLLLTALSYTLTEITGSNKSHIFLEGHGREEIDRNIDITRALGWFTTIYPVRLETFDTIGTSIMSIKESLRNIPHKGLGFGPLLGYKSNALPRVSFNYLGQFGEKNCNNTDDKDFWRIVKEDSGISMSLDNWDSNVINLNGLVLDDRLKFSIVSKLDKATTYNFACIFEKQLEAVIIHTVNQTRSFLTVSDINGIISKERLDALQESREIEAIYVANNLQQGFIYHALSQGDVDDAYHVQNFWQYHYRLNINNLKQAWRYAQVQYSSLRLRFDWQEILIQIIDKENSLDCRYIDISDEINKDKQNNIIEGIKEKDRSERFDLAQGALFRIYLIKQDQDLHSCIFSNHHAILDGWSMPILLGFVHDTYLRLNREEHIVMQPDDAYQAAQYYIQEHQDDSKAYWEKYIAQAEGRSDLSGLQLYCEQRLSDYKQILHPTKKKLVITGDLYSSLKVLSQEEGVTFNAILQYVWHKVLHVYGNNKHTIVGTVLSGRSLPVDNIEKSVGLYINTVPLIVNHEASKHIIESIKDIQSNIIEFNERSIVNLAKLQQSAVRLFDSLFVYENYPDQSSLVQTEIKLTNKGSEEKLDYPLVVIAFEANKEIIFELQYAGELFFDDTVNNLLYLTRTILEQLPSHKYQAVTNIRYLNAEQHDLIIHRWNATDTEYPANKTIHQLFEEQVVKTPDNVAVVFKDEKLTYREINKRANQLASYLRDGYNIEPDTLIPLFLDRSEHMIIAILAALKSGGAYVPIDPCYPDERIQYILQDTNSSLLLTNEIHRERLKCISCLDDSNLECLTTRQPVNILCIDGREFEDKLFGQAVNNPKTTTKSTHLAYLIYTSGTTGKPKGVMVEHKGLVNLNYALVNRYELGGTSDQEVILQLSNYVFDLSVEQIILGLLNGHMLLLVPNQLWLNDVQFYDYLFINKVTHINATPRFLEQHNFKQILSLRRVVSAGEFLGKELYGKICLNDSVKIINAYGPTEVSVISTVKIIKKGDVSIGSPIYNTRCYVLAPNLVPVPVGAIGELYIGGAGLARGYLNNPNITSKKFIANPFQTEAEKISGKFKGLYKTGDLVRWLPDGNLEYIGRNDFQVKIRGYRIELGEIESTLLSYKGIKQSVALARKNNNVASDPSSIDYLVGYYVSDDKLDEEAIRHYLGSKLPDYMVPTILVHLNKLPLTINGKLDRKALPDPQFTSQNKYVAPRNDIEEKLCQIWTDVLGLATDKVGIHDDFFRLGGDSIISIQLVSRLRKKLQLNVSVKDIFRHKSIARLSENVLRKAHSEGSNSTLQTEQGILAGAVPLLPVQEWFFSRNFRDAHHWNQSFLIKTPRLDLDKLEDSLDKLIQYHDCFRLRYKKDEKSNCYKQYYDRDSTSDPVRVLNIDSIGYEENSEAFNTKLQQILTNWQANFDLTGGPMHSAGYIYGYQDGSARIYFALHHLIVDAVSWRILNEDLRDLYYGKTLGRKGSSYRQWAKIVKEYPRIHKKEQLFWNCVLSDHDSSRLNNLIESEFTVNFETIELSQEYTALLLHESNRAYHTQINDLLLTALAYTLTEITGNNINHVLLESHGREEVDSTIDITRTTGWFTTLYPVRLEITNEKGNSIMSIKESLRSVPHKGIGFRPKFGYQSDALPRITFNYLGQFGQANSENLTNENMWQIVEEDSGVSMSPANWDTNIIDFNGLIIAGRLKFSIVSKLDKRTTYNLATLFKKQLEVLIDQTINQPRGFLTVSDIDYIVTKERLDALQESREVEAIYLANNLQQVFIYHAVSQGDIYNAFLVQFFWRYHCSVNVSNLKQAWEYAQVKYSTLRLRFDWQEELVQIIDKKGDLDWHYIDLSNELNEDEQENIIKDIREKDKSEHYDLARGSLFRIYLVKQNMDHFCCIFSNHHAILDGWSMPILLGYVHDTYLKLERSDPIDLQPDFEYEAAQHYIKKHQNSCKNYWEKYIAQVEGRSNLSGLLLNRDKRLSEYTRILRPTDRTLTITGNLYSSLKLLSQQEGVTINAVIQYVWHKVLHVFGNNKQTIVGTTVSGRSLPVNDIEKSVGLYINTLPLIVNHQANIRVIESIKDIQSNIIEFNEKSIVNLTKLQPSGERLFDSLFVYENYPNPAGAAQDKVKLKYEDTVEMLDIPIIVRAYEAKDEVILQLQYAGELFNEVAIDHLFYLARDLLEQLPCRAHQAVSNLSYLNPQQYEHIIYSWNATDQEYPAEKTVHQLFEEQVAKTPENVALIYEQVQLTYKQLNKRANQLAVYLMHEYIIKPNSLIILCLGRSEHMLIAILAILKSGGAYVPIDPSYPEERIQYILHDTNSTLLLTDETHREKLEGICFSVKTNQERLLQRQTLKLISLDSQEFRDQLSLQAGTDPKSSTTSSDLAYVIYTSGTTGKPKGVMIEHRGLINLNYALVKSYAFGDADDEEVILQFLNYAFDASVEDIILALLNGHVLLMIPNNLWLDTEKFIDYLLVNKVTHIQATPTFLVQHNFSKITSLKRLVPAGEFLSKQSYDKICINGRIIIINSYGPTETSVTSIVKIISNGHINIGTPISNTRCYVLADNLVPLPVGATGELYIGGAGMARGYLNQPALTAEKFITNPFQTEEEKSLGKYTRIYKTGDLVRWLPDGNLEYIGRNDLQVKIRGYRIELGEIENALLDYKAIKQSVVLAKEHGYVAGKSSGNKYLVGYYVSDEELDEATVLHFLESKLPNYMIPNILVHLSKLPLTINSKLDRKALPDPEFTSKDNYVAPRNEMEEKACQIWADVLNLEACKVGTHDDFFKLGGDSIVSIQLVSRLRQKLQLNVSVKDIFYHKSIARLYENVLSKAQNLENVSTLQTEQGILVGAFPLLPVQEWFFSRNFSKSHHWNQSLLIKTPRLDLDKLQNSLEKLMQHHDGFRLRYKKDERNNHYEQYYDSYAKVEPVRVLDIESLGYEETSQTFNTNLQEFLTNWQANFDLTDGPMYSIGYIHGYQDGSARIYFALHHLIVDTISWRIVSEDLRDLYYGKTLGRKGSSYRQWANTLKDYPSKHHEEALFWNNILSDQDNSRFDNLIESESTANNATIELSQEYTSLLLQKCNLAYYTEISDLLLTSLGFTLKVITGSNINHIVVEGHGREEIDRSIDITRTLGCFTTIHPVRLEIVDSLGTCIMSIKESLRSIPHKGLGFGPIIGYQSDYLPRVKFNYISQYGHDTCNKVKEKNYWQIVGEERGISVIPNSWDTNFINFKCRIIKGSLKISVVSKLNEKTNNILASVFQKQLTAIINHTINQPRSYLSPSDIDNIISKERLDALQESREIEAVYLANNLQRGFIYHALSLGDVDDAYIVQNCWQYHHEINMDNLKKAWKYAQEKFSSLRIRFDWQEKLLQIIYKEDCLEWRYMDLSDELNVEKQKNTIKDVQEKDRFERYDLAQGALFRVYLVKQNRELYSCIFSNHHAILDGWSMPILVEYIHDTYLKLDRKEPVILQPDVAYKAAQHYIQKHQEDSKAYWDTYILQVEGRSNLSGLLIDRDKRLSEYKQILYPAKKTLIINGHLYNSLKLFSQQEGFTLSAILQYVWHKVHHVYGNNKQTIVGTTLSGRCLPVDNIEKSVGLFINTLPLIVDHQGSKRLLEAIKGIQSTIIEFNERSIVDLAKLQQSAERLFDSLFVYENYPDPTSVPQDNFKLVFNSLVEKIDYPLSVKAYETKDQVIFQLHYASELFSVDSVNNLLNLTWTLLEQLPSRAYQAVTNLRYLNAQQHDQIIYHWNATDKEYPAYKTIHQLFEEQVVKTPENIAIVYEDIQLTYRELNERANQLANYLKDGYNIEPDDLIPLCLDRSEHMIIAILAVLKSGGAYVPIDPSYPDERIQFILKDTNASFLLTNEIHLERLEGISTNLDYLKPNRKLNIVPMDNWKFKNLLSLKPISNTITLTASANLAYVIYTSGTTGQPKGVMVEHRGLVNLHFHLVDSYALGNANEQEVILQLLNFVFDAFVEQFITALLNGYVLLLIPNQMWLNKEQFINYLMVNKVTHISATPRFLEQHIFDDILSLKRIVSGGDFLSQQCYDKLHFNINTNIINEYGPTETSVISIMKMIKNGIINMGSPISNTRCYVLAENLVPVPVGAIGELCIAGPGLARGYLNRPDLTAERFIANPFQTEEEKRLGKYKRLYKTGDLVRWLQDGNLEYIGRNDLQVKIRGYRIELGEIANNLLGYKGIKQSVALAKEHRNVTSGSSGNKFLVGYYVSDDKLNEEAILQYLGSKLPDYMVPSILVHLHELPLTINGKLDRKALPDPEFTSKNTFVAPRNEIEEKVGQIFADVLGLDADSVGIHDDFFKLGGDSIISIQLVSKLRKELQLNVSVGDIFSHKSIARLCENVLRTDLIVDSVSNLQAEQGILVGTVPLLPVQEWFFSQDFSDAHHWNQSFLVKTPRLDLSKLQDSLDKLVQYHDSFRLRFKKDRRSNHYEQYYDSYAKKEPVRVLDIKTLGYEEKSQAFNAKLQELLTNWQVNFDLTDGPMHSVGYIYGYQDGSARIHFALHHLIADAVSWRIVSEDLRDLYYGKTLGSKGSSYRQWAKILMDYPNKHQEEQLYWNNILSDYESSHLNNLIESEYTANFTSIIISQEYTNFLVQESNQAYETQINDLLLTALGYTLTEITGNNINHVILVGHGREEIDNSIDITRTLGWFTMIFPVRLEICDSLGTSIKYIKEALRTMPHKGLGFGPMLGYKSDALPRVAFNYLGQFGPDNSEKVKDNDIWQILREDSGIAMSPNNWDTNIIYFNGLIFDGSLEFSIVSKLDQKTTNDLASIFKQQLEDVINHTKNLRRNKCSLRDIDQITSKDS